MAGFVLKSRDTRPILEVQLTNPDGSAHDLTGSTNWELHVRLVGSIGPLGTELVFTRAMVKQGLDPEGVLRYTWVDADWVGVGALPTVAVDRILEYPMEYEVTSGTSRMTFPNDGYDILQIRGDVA